MDRRSSGKKFFPQQVLFSPTTQCNLNCRHCFIKRERKNLSPSAAIRFLKSCKKLGIERIGFTGGEPFLAPAFLYPVIRYAVKNDWLFDRITTNAAWFKNAGQLDQTLKKLRDCGYDGSFNVSLDSFHGQNPSKAAQFIKAAGDIWNRRDIAQIVAVKGARDEETALVLKRLAAILKAKVVIVNGRKFIKSASLLLCVKTIDLVPIGKAKKLAAPWGKGWFREDYCQGPGHVFYVLPDGRVKPCCGYATDADPLTLGTVHRDTASKLLKNAARNRFVTAVFKDGLTRIRRRLMKQGVSFPAETKNHCYFCHYILTKIPRQTLEKSL